jgi:hypothetical protein
MTDLQVGNDGGSGQDHAELGLNTGGTAGDVGGGRAGAGGLGGRGSAADSGDGGGSRGGNNNGAGGGDGAGRAGSLGNLALSGGRGGLGLGRGLDGGGGSSSAAGGSRAGDGRASTLDLEPLGVVGVGGVGGVDDAESVLIGGNSLGDGDLGGRAIDAGLEGQDRLEVASGAGDESNVAAALAARELELKGLASSNAAEVAVEELGLGQSEGGRGQDNSRVGLHLDGLRFEL